MSLPACLRLLALCLLAHVGASHAQRDTDALLATLKATYPTMTIDAVNKTPVPGLYEVVLGRQLAYTDASGRYFMFGSVVDMQTREDLSATRLELLSRIDVRTLPLKDAFTRVVGKGRRHLYVFSDPDCPYCRRLEPELDKLDDVTIHTFLYPIAQLHSDAGRKAESIWCQGDDKARWARWHHVVGHDDAVETRQCDNPLERNLALGQSLGVVGTPTLVAADGRTLPGMKPAAFIEGWLAPTKVATRPPANLK
ncbi:MAG: DsbC family protein [Betaproteobacteria bacterium]